MTPNGPAVESRLIAALSPAERIRLEPYIEAVELPARTVLSECGELISHAVFPARAITSTLMQLPEGDTVEVGLMGAEGMVGLALLYGDRIASTSVVVQVAGWGYRIEREAFLREVVGRGGEFYRLLLRYANMFMAMVAQVAACNASHSIEQRLARWLLLVADRIDAASFPLTHEFLALMLGVRRASVTQSATALRQAGAIEYHSGVVTIVDRNELEAASCGCYAVMRDLAERIFTPPGEPLVR